jgi:N5-(cytidine 5'-diphosphoramidyl)-L-glutamine hydrolase
VNGVAIGITQRYLPATSYAEARDGLDRQWHLFMQAAHLVAVPLPNVPALAERMAYQLGLRGVILSGGEDLEAYGGPAAGRDETDAALLRWAMACQLPVLGVCRGAQVLLHRHGVKLHEVEGHIRRTQGIAGWGRITCYHRLAGLAAEMPDDLELTAAVGGVVEAFAVRDTAAPVVGVMGHPERAISFEARHVDVVRAFFGGKP